MKLVMAVLAVLALAFVGPAEAAWTVDLTSLTTDVTTIGVAILGLAVVIFGFKVVRRMVGR